MSEMLSKNTLQDHPRKFALLGLHPGESLKTEMISLEEM